MKTYPIFLIKLDRRRCVVLGGGGEAERKVSGLVDCAATVVLIAATVTPGLRRLAEGERIQWIDREYAPGDLGNAFLVISSLTDPKVNRLVWAEAELAGALCNVMDDTDHCNFIAGSVVRRGDLKVAISTGGHAPALAVRLRERLERELGPEYGSFLELAAELRPSIANRRTDFESRRALWYQLVDSDAIELLRNGRSAAARRRLAEIIRDGHP